MRCSSVRLSTPISPSTPGLLLVGAHRLRAERLTTRVGSISPTSSGTKRDFYSALSFDRAAAGRAGPADALLRNPITGVAGCCARAASRNRAAEQRDELAPPSLDHLIGNGEQRGRNAESERCGRLAVDRQLEFGRLWMRSTYDAACRYASAVSTPWDIRPPVMPR